MLRVVVLPQPEGPTRTTNSPSGMVRSIPSTARVAPNTFARRSRRIPATRYFRRSPKLKPRSRCFWMRKPSTTTCSVAMVPMAACGP